ncbi:type 1 glutamine amidotransferase [Hymenobacter latericus]|uniref:type 1 glutamine amidotransferase n=1 Tax=Hymenobacter sp. YIM 151858-1 TaxID=2987688 RepID=UPI0022272BFC|nr:type 1 glutamine amidotransferase [Hymenobacter sp. YIM 151858-1]UYZ60605.1 type 1 glutamine amidotransferase [Hymenobacter sp. YIM 151858-1]
MRIHCLQHIPFETPGLISDWARQHNHQLSVTRFDQPDPRVPALEELDWLVVLGGAMSVHDDDRFGWLPAEKALIGQAIAAGKTVLGICLGAQLVAHALGAGVAPNPEPEIGFYPVQFTAEAQRHPLFAHAGAQATFLHWHGDTFSLPTGAVPLGASAACAQQGFAYGTRVTGLQFHPEMTPEILEQMLLHDGHELVPAPHVQTAAELRRGMTHLGPSQRFLFGLLDALAARPGT